MQRPASTSTHNAISPRPQAPGGHVVNTQTKVLDGVHGRILCVADIRGRLSALNDLAREANAQAIIHTGDFGFFEASSLDRINDRTLRHLTMYSPLIPSAQRTHLLAPENPSSAIRATVNINLLSEFPNLLSGQIKLQVPVYTVWGACEDVAVLEKFRAGIHVVENLHVLDEATTRVLDVGGVKLRLLGLGGALVPHKMFDNGDGAATIAGGQGTMWATALQIGELVDTAQRVYDPSETRLLVTHASPGREGIMAQLALITKADLTISAGLHFRYASSYNEFSVQGDFDGFRHKLQVGKEAFDKVWESVKTQVDAVIDENQRVLLDKALSVVEKLPPPGGAEEASWKNCWNWNLCDAAYGSLVLDVKDGRVSAELKSQGFNYAYRRTATPVTAATPSSASSPLPGTAAKSAGSEKPIPPHLNNRSANATPPNGAKDSPPRTNGASPAPGAAEKAEKEKQKRKDKKDRKDKERAEREAKDVDEVTSPADGPAEVQLPPPKSETPVPEASASASDTGPKSPTADSTGGARTPTGKNGKKNPWTIFMRMPAHVQVTDTELRAFFGTAAAGIVKINMPTAFAGRAKIAYVEFGDEEAMRAGLEGHAEKLKDTVPEVKQATPPEERGAGGPRGGPGRGRGGRGGYAARGFAAAGLTK
ncbi:hypothetical protein HWV62_10869 [Athelia sp. TMB]|nr:hypothetical protein HWV62_10869 [Athelia sp. TMB]